MAEPTVSPQERPQFIIDAPDELITLRVSTLDGEIWKYPARYLTALGTIAALGTQNSPDEASNDDDAHAQLREFFEQRYDRLTDFDDSTEKAIENDEVFKQKQRSLKDTSASRAEQTRKDISELRLRTYIERVNAWKQAQAEDAKATG